MRGGIGQELQDRERRHRLARAGLADQRDRLLLVDVERDAAHRMHGRCRPGGSRRARSRTERRGGQALTSSARVSFLIGAGFRRRSSLMKKFERAPNGCRDVDRINQLRPSDLACRALDQNRSRRPEALRSVRPDKQLFVARSQRDRAWCANRRDQNFRQGYLACRRSNLTVVDQLEKTLAGTCRMARTPRSRR